MNNENKEVLLSVQNLCQYFSVNRRDFKAVDDISFDVYKGEVFGLVGESGCGKTTTGRTIIKINEITSGNIFFKGVRIGAGIRSYRDEIKKIRAELKKKFLLSFKASAEDKKAYAVFKQEASERINQLKIEIAKAKHDQKNCNHDYAKVKVQEVNDQYRPLIENEPDLEKKEAIREEYNKHLRIAKRSRIVTSIQMIFQDPIGSLNPRMTIKEIIAEGLIIKGIKDKHYIQSKVEETLELVGLVKEHASRYPHEFSGGQRQRIGIARSIIMEPDMIIADEPVSALDVSIQAQVINLLNSLRSKLGLTILFVAHDLSVVKYFSDRIGVMYYGKLVELASSEELFKRPLHPYTRSLLSAIPLPDPEFEKHRVRITYNPIKEHDYSTDLPSIREVFPGHFVYCNNLEEAKYQELAKSKNEK